MKEYSVCYTLDADVKRVKIRKWSCIKKEDILQEVLRKVEHCNFLMINSENQKLIINTSKIRYIRIFDE